MQLEKMINVIGRGDIILANIEESERYHSFIENLKGTIISFENRDYEVKAVEFTNNLMHPGRIGPNIGLVVRQLTGKRRWRDEILPEHTVVSVGELHQEISRLMINRKLSKADLVYLRNYLFKLPKS